MAASTLHYMSLPEIAKLLGGTTNGRWINLRGPGHKSKDGSLGFKFDAKAPDGIIVNSFADDHNMCRKYILDQLHAISHGQPLKVKLNLSEDDQIEAKKRIAAALAIWNDGMSPTGTIAEKYLLARSCQIPVFVIAEDMLRFHPACPFGPHTVPAMLFQMRSIATGESTGIHRTALADDGSAKRIMTDGSNARKMMGIAKGSVVMLGNASEHLGIAEGIETALSAQEIFGIPVWATMSARGMADFPVIQGLKRLAVFADYDPVGLKAAKTCARRYASAGISAEVRYPEERGLDWNDWLQQEKADGTQNS